MLLNKKIVFVLLYRCIHFINKAINSVNQTVKTLSNMGKYGSYSILCSNYGHLKYKYNMEINNVVKVMFLDPFTKKEFLLNTLRP